MAPLQSSPASALQGEIEVPGDKSISHRALILGALAIGESQITGLLEGEDVLNTAAALRALGAGVTREESGLWRVQGCGVGGLAEPPDILDMGNSGTAARLLLGVLATHPFTAFMTGDASLRSRPMVRVTNPLSQIGATFLAHSGGRLPLAVTGSASPMPITYTTPVPSAQVKSAILLAGLNAPGQTTVIETQATRDHTELMLRHFGASISVEEDGPQRRITLQGQPEIAGTTVKVPGDPSSAAFPAVAALLLPGSDILIRNIGMNRLRTGLFDSLCEMGANIQVVNSRNQAGEAVADLKVCASTLAGIEVPADRAPRMIDEYPILAVAAACAQGRTVMHGLGELRVKESDRLAAIAEGLAACGVKAEAGEDSLTIEGGSPTGGGEIRSRMDHRIAMAFLVLGMATKEPVRIDDAAAIDTSFPGFITLMNQLGGKIHPVGGAS